MAKKIAAAMAAAGTITLALLAGCGEPDKVEQATADAAKAASPTVADTEEKTGSLLETGFGQNEAYVYLVAIVQNTSNKVGQTVTVNFNVLDAAGEILTSKQQVETFSRPGQKMPVATQAEVPRGKKVAKVEATLQVKDEGTFSSEPFPQIKTSAVKIVKSEFGGYDARVEVTNPTGQPLESPRVDVVCRNAAKKIVGGGFDFPEMVPPSGKVVADMQLLVSGRPTSCEGYAGPSPLTR
jgi:hypothetical protein